MARGNMAAVAGAARRSRHGRRTMLIMGSANREVRQTMELSRSMRIVCRPSKEALHSRVGRCSSSTGIEVGQAARCPDGWQQMGQAGR
jgi:hypothetical protein